MDNQSFCIAYECPLPEVPEDMLDVCHQLGDSCESCRCCRSS